MVSPSHMQRTEREAVVVHLAMPPRTHHQKVFVVAGVFRFDRCVAVDRAPHVFLVPQALQPHHRHFQRDFGHDLVERLALPESVVGGVLFHLAPERKLVEAVEAREIAGRAEPQKLV